MSTAFPPPIEELYETFEELEDWQDRYEFILDLGRELPAMDANLQTEDNKVHGCMSLVWMAAHTERQNGKARVKILADSDSLIVKGLIVILLTLYDERSPSEIIAVDAQQIFGRLGLDQHLSPNRRNGLFSMVKRIREIGVEVESKDP